MYQLQQTHPDVWHDFENVGFTVKTNFWWHSQLYIRNTIMSKVHKADGGLSGIATYPNYLLRYCLPELARLSAETEAMLGLKQPNKKQHHQISQKKF